MDRAVVAAHLLSEQTERVLLEAQAVTELHLAFLAVALPTRAAVVEEHGQIHQIQPGLVALEVAVLDQILHLLAPLEQPTPEAVVVEEAITVLPTALAVQAAPASSSSNTPSPSNLS